MLLKEHFTSGNANAMLGAAPGIIDDHAGTLPAFLGLLCN
jgi:hypothetical protein